MSPKKIEKVLRNKNIDINVLESEYPLLFFKMDDDPEVVTCLLKDSRIDVNIGKPGALKKALLKYYAGAEKYEQIVHLFLAKDIDFEKNYEALTLLLRFCTEKKPDFLNKCDQWSASLLMNAYNVYQVKS